jgi:aerobic C4-dicarboxylate transport protein
MATRKPLYQTLYFQVIVGIIAGITLGFFFPSIGEAMRPLGEAFIKLVKMMIAPVIFCTVVLGIAKMKNLKEVGRVGLKALLYFEILSSLALVIGLIIVNIVKPGASIQVDPASIDPAALSPYANAAKSISTVEFLMNIIPNTFIDAFAHGEILQVLLISLLFGFAVAGLGEKAARIVDLLDETSHILFSIISILMKFAPLGAFGAIAFTIGKYGLGSLSSLGQLLGCVYGACIFFVFAILGTLMRLTGLSLWKLLRYIREELLIVLGTSSSESVLPRIMNKLERLGCGRSVVGLVIPTGYSFNLDGTSIYLTAAAIFVAQATNTPLTLGDQLTILGILLLTSKGAAAVTGSGFVTLAATLSSAHTIPVSGLALLIGVDRFMSEARAITNLIGNCVATIVISKWEKDFDTTRAEQVFRKTPT